mmetsp:Transcript_35593/g.92803  ORF Transcript_35593/g.92803 Transcript_35593/m.92803 type:complete len:193 (+) Transcript_35593:37-615(+)
MGQYIMKIGRSLALFAGSCAAADCAAVFVYNDGRFRDFLPNPVFAAARSSITLATALAIAFDYKLSLRGLSKGSKDYKEKKVECHSRAGKRLLDLCLLHGGAFVKVGQQVASYHYVLPKEYTVPLATLQDNGPTEEWDNVRDTIQSELSQLRGVPTKIGDVYSSFEKSPFASASLAQVHEAVLMSGTRVRGG